MGSTTDSWASEPVAIIGLSCKFAGDATSPDNLWTLLEEGRSAWSEIPSSRYNPKGAYHPSREKLSTESNPSHLLMLARLTVVLVTYSGRSLLGRRHRVI